MHKKKCYAKKKENKLCTSFSKIVSLKADETRLASKSPRLSPKVMRMIGSALVFYENPRKSKKKREKENR